MDDVVVFDDHAEDFNLYTKIDNVVVDMTRHHFAGKNLKFRSTVIEVTHSTVGDGSKAAKSFVDVGLYFSPESTGTRVGFKLLHDSNCRMGCFGYLFIVGQWAIA